MGCRWVASRREKRASREAPRRLVIRFPVCPTGIASGPHPGLARMLRAIWPVNEGRRQHVPDHAGAIGQDRSLHPGHRDGGQRAPPFPRRRAGARRQGGLRPLRRHRAATALAALQAGEADRWEQQSFDLLPVMQADDRLKVGNLDPSGFMSMMRMNQLFPPFDNAAARRALEQRTGGRPGQSAEAHQAPELWASGPRSAPAPLGPGRMLHAT